jgi:hypothetical protein
MTAIIIVRTFQPICQSKDPNARIHETKLAKRSETRGMAIGSLRKSFFVKEHLKLKYPIWI